MTQFLFDNLATGDFIKVVGILEMVIFLMRKVQNTFSQKTGTYTVKQTVTYPFGCQYVYSATVLPEKGYSLMMPNAFTQMVTCKRYFSPVFWFHRNDFRHLRYIHKRSSQ
jgi:hypothetical protein